jgi:dihydrofolate reductase
VITLIVARADNGVIGKDGALPWHLPADLKRFKALTMGKPMIMGRKTEVAHDVAGALALAGENAFVIGGAEIFSLFEPHADTFELTEVHNDAKGDTRMPAPDPAVWVETAREDHDGYSFVTLARRP